MDFPFIYIHFSDLNALKHIIGKSVLIKHFLLPFGEGNSYNELLKNIDYTLLKKYSLSGENFAFVVEAH